MWPRWVQYVMAVLRKDRSPGCTFSVYMFYFICDICDAFFFRCRIHHRYDWHGVDVSIPSFTLPCLRIHSSGQ